MRELRRSVLSFDDMAESVRLNVPVAAFVVISWSALDRKCVVVGFLDHERKCVDASKEVLLIHTVLLYCPISVEALLLLFPDREGSFGGDGMFEVSVDASSWRRALDTVFEEICASLYVPTPRVVDVLWLVLEAHNLPNGHIVLERVVVVPELEHDAAFVPVSCGLSVREEGEGVSWNEASDVLGGDVSGRFVTLASYIAEMKQGGQVALGNGVLFTGFVVEL